MRKLRACAIVVIAVLASGSLKANSQCIVMTTAQAKGLAQTVLLGRVVGVERERFRYILTVEVERVWKGALPKRITLHQSDPRTRPSIVTRFQVGETYVIFAGLVGSAIYSDYVDDCMSKPATSFDFTELGESTLPQL
jgi:hypothetical protein